MELSAVKKQSRVEPLRAVNPLTPEPLKVVACSFYVSTDGDAADPTPRPLPPPTDSALQQQRRVGGSDEEKGAPQTQIEEAKEAEEEEEAEDHLAAHGEAYLEQTGEATKVLTSCEELLPSPTNAGAEDQGKEDGDKDIALPAAVVAPDKGGVADRRDQHIVFFLGSGGMAVANGEKSKVVGGVCVGVGLANRPTGRISTGRLRWVVPPRLCRSHPRRASA
ncbi:hypothetical protein GUJ93_ZPchr0015g6610 [Zizania palustris]|uniref:Uncharacterized protein n=1 Tax=Zizania palustris TaxID=103762 RepID=A0A8J5THE4_ZIZPA|nr:hypothetical protein GUJ93_ZPchr0015g6610 [Zizania palustris]